MYIYILGWVKLYKPEKLRPSYRFYFYGSIQETFPKKTLLEVSSNPIKFQTNPANFSIKNLFNSNLTYVFCKLFLLYIS